MKAAIKRRTTERVILELTVQEAHLIDSLLGNTPDEVAREFGVAELMKVWCSLNRALGNPNGKSINITRSERM